MDWESALGEGHEFLDEVCPLVQKDVEFCFLGFVEKGSLGVQWQGGGGGSVAGGPVLSTMLELWESPLGFVQMVDMSLLSSRPRGKKFTLAFGSEFLIWFSTMETDLCTVKGKMRLDMGQPWASPLFMVWVMKSPSSSLHLSSCPALKRTAHHFPHVFV